MQNWNAGKREEFKDRLEYTEQKGLAQQLKVKPLIEDDGTTAVEAHELITNSESIIKSFRIFTIPHCEKCSAAKEYLMAKIQGTVVNLGEDEGLKEFRTVYKQLKDKLHRNEDGSLPIPTILLYDENDRLVTVAHQVDDIKQVI